jgi:DNA-binding transcriptional ArsR family regulator
MTATPHLNNVMKTLADPTRRAVFERIACEEEITAGALVAGTRVSQPAVSQHLRALREAGLVSERREGRHVHYRVRHQGLSPLVGWLEFYAEFWTKRLDKLEQLLSEMDKK